MNKFSQNERDKINQAEAKSKELYFNEWQQINQEILLFQKKESSARTEEERNKCCLEKLKFIERRLVIQIARHQLYEDLGIDLSHSIYPHRKACLLDELNNVKQAKQYFMEVCEEV